MAGSPPQSQSQPIFEEEVIKRNTDCVYFLASPLTCKKGSECDFRHSDVARLNLRDCYFWLHGNCLNPKCGFRHPPLEGLLGTEVPAPTGPSAPVSQTITAPTPHVSIASNKVPGVTCIFFQKGYCLKGDWCPFMHVPNSLSIKPSLTPVTAPPAQPPTNNKTLSGPEKSVQETKVPPVTVSKSIKHSTVAKSTFDVEPTLFRNESSQTTPVSNGIKVDWPARFQPYRDSDDPEPDPENLISKDADDVSREPSPGFDVLVDDDIRDPGYYPDEDRYEMSREVEALNECDTRLDNDYDSVTAVHDEGYQGRPVGYVSNEHRKGQYDGYGQHRASYSERRPYSRPDTVRQDGEIDLRHRLAKHEKPNGLRSVISHENTRDVQVGESQRSYYGENPFNGRLRGRISLPRSSLSPNKREIIRSGGLFPARANMSLHQGRIRDGVRGRVYGGFNRGPYSRRENSGDGTFDGPKSLAELKNRKNDSAPSGHVVTDRKSVGKRKHTMHKESGNGLSFEGPKPLKEILKRKRGETNRDLSIDDEGLAEDKIREEDLTGYGKTITLTGRRDEIYNSTSVRESVVGVGPVDQVLESYEERDGESDYERVGGEDYDDVCDVENENNGEYADEDDDDFAKRMGVMCS